MFIPISASSIQLELDSSINLKYKLAKIVHKICIFHRLKTNCEDFAKFLKALEWAYCFDYKQEESGEDKTRRKFWEETIKILFSNYFLKKAEDWYDNLEVEKKAG